MKSGLFSLLFFIPYSIFSQINNEHLNIGDIAPQILATDQKGKKIDSDEILKKNKILLVFYRGNWCPHCKKHLKSLQDHLNEFNKKGVYVMVVTPETVERTQETADKFKITFSIIHDMDNQIMNDYKVAFEINKFNIPNYYGIVSKKVAAYNDENNSVLPVPATYLINEDGKISFVQYDVNYKNRSDFDKVLKSL